MTEEKPKIVFRKIPHRYFHVDGKKEFSLFFNDEVKKPKDIIQQFLKTHDWIMFENYNEVKYSSFTNSKDLLDFYIITKSTKEEEPKVIEKPKKNKKNEA